MENLSGTKVPILTKEDLESLEEMCGTTSGYFYKMLDYLDERVRDGVRRGLFTQEQAEEDLELALWYAYACNNLDEYRFYYRQPSGCQPRVLRQRRRGAVSGTTATPAP